MLLPAAATAATPLPRATTLSRGWEVRNERSAPAEPQPPPPEESAPGSPPQLPSLRGQASAAGPYRPATVPGVFDPRALPALYPGTVRRYRVRFRGPATPRGFRWLISFEEVRRSAKVYLNGRLVGRNGDPYTPFTVWPHSLRPRRPNTLDVVVDNRKDPRLHEGWWNWGGIVRAVRLVPVGHAYLNGLGLMSRVRCRGPARACRASLVLDAALQRNGGDRIAPELTLKLRSPRGRVIQKRFRLPRQRAPSRPLRLTLKVPAPELWSPAHPRLYSALLVLRDKGRLQQVVRQHVGLRSVTVKYGRLYLNNRPLQLRGASIHEDMPGDGAALSRGDVQTIVSDLKQLGANVTRAHYLLDQRLLNAFDRAGIMVWNEAAVYQRDFLLRYPSQRRRAWLTVRRTVTAARSHPSVITHSVANELSSNPDAHPTTARFLTVAAAYARQLDPTLPVAVDIRTSTTAPAQAAYARFDVLGFNNYFGWYSWTPDFSGLEPYMTRLRALYPRQALVMTEFGAEGLPELADAPLDELGGYAFQAMHANRTLDVVDRSRFLSGAIYWTLREFEIFPGWNGGAPSTPKSNTRHHKGLLTYDGARKPAWYIVQSHYLHTPLYAPSRRGQR
jgi:hypothetical protein